MAKPGGGRMWLTAEQLHAFITDVFVILHGVLDPVQLATARDRMLVYRMWAGLPRPRLEPGGADPSGPSARRSKRRRRLHLEGPQQRRRGRAARPAATPAAPIAEQLLGVGAVQPPTGEDCVDSVAHVTPGRCGTRVHTYGGVVAPRSLRRAQIAPVTATAVV
jgi:hypothetical protein